MRSRPTPRGSAAHLWVLAALLALFCLRVFGQLVAALTGAPFLPPMEEWFSGLIPYPRVLTAQVLIIAVYGKVVYDFARGSGFFITPRQELGRGLLGFGMIYLGVMVIRYVVRMSLYPPEHWTGGSIPTFFHWVLAGFILTLGHYQWTRADRAKVSPDVRRRRRVLGIAGGVLVLTGIVMWVAYLFAPWALARILDIRPPAHAVRVHRGVTMTTSDGIELVADLFRPVRADPAPTILVRVNYTKTLKNRLFADVVGRMWAEHGYTVVLQGTRGRGESGGTFYPMRYERADGIETLKWLGEHPWFDGRLGMWGGSYFGYTQWVLADQRDPGPSALLIQIASTDFYRMFYPGAAFALESGLYWALRSRGPVDVPVDAAMLERGYGAFPLIEADNRAAEDVPFFNDWVSHPERDAYWLEIDGTDRAAGLEAPVLLMAGWFDPFLPTQLADFVRIRSVAKPAVARGTRLIVGPWSHAETVILPGNVQPRNYRLESFMPSIGWFDQHLRPLSAGPAVSTSWVRTAGARNRNGRWRAPCTRRCTSTLPTRRSLGAAAHCNRNSAPHQMCGLMSTTLVIRCRLPAVRCWARGRASRGRTRLKHD